MKPARKIAAVMALSSIFALSSMMPAVPAKAAFQDASYVTSAVNQAQHPAFDTIERASEKMLEDLKRDAALLKQKPDHIYTLMQQNVLEHFDFDAISRMVLGKYSRQATDEQKERFADAFSKMVIRQYAEALRMFSGQDIEYKPVRAANDERRVKVQTSITQDSGPSISVDYSLYRDKNDEWKVYDVAIEGVSLAMTYRSSFGSAIRSKGLDKLIDELEQKNRSAGNAAPSAKAPSPGFS